MRLSRLVPVLAAGALVVASTSPVQAQTEPVTGVGTTTGALTLLGLDAGDLLTLELLTDAGAANIDEATGPRNAAAQIAALALDTAVTDPISVPLLSVSSSGEEETAGQDVALPANPLVSGSVLPLSLSALVDEVGARSSIAAALTSLDVLGGVASLATSSLDLGSSAATADAAGARGVEVGALTVLDLEALLELLGIPLADLPLDTLLGLLDGLGLLDQLEALLPAGTDLSVDGIVAVVDGLLVEADDLLAQIDQVETLIDEIASLEEIQETLTTDASTCNSLGDLDDLLGGGDTLGELCNDVSGTLNQITSQLATLNAALDALPSLSTLTDLLRDLLDQLQAILEAPLSLLSGVALLSLDGLDVTVTTKATDDVDTSVAEVTGTLGQLRVGELPVLGALDLTAPTAQLDALLAQAESLIGDILGGIAPSLSDLVSITSMQEATSVEATDAGGVVSTASFTGLDVQVLPILGELEALLASLGELDSVGAILTDLGLAVPLSGATEVLAVNDLLAPVTDGLPLLGALAALEDGLGLQVATLSQQSTFTPFAASAPVAPGTPGAPGSPAGPAAPAPTLPRTGSDDSLLLALAGAAVLAALGGRQLVRRADGEA
jgi:LPXTG-motif cell wall-anchored protein